MTEENNINEQENENSNPGGNEMDSEYLVSVFKTDNMAIIAVVKSILDEAGIKYLAQGDGVQSVVPINAFPVDFKVMPEDETYAKELLSNVDEDSDWYDEDSPDDADEENTKPQE